VRAIAAPRRPAGAADPSAAATSSPRRPRLPIMAQPEASDPLVPLHRGFDGLGWTEDRQALGRH
jgi:hypothetical protein